MREYFHFFSHGLTNATSIDNPYVILDTNVLNIISSMALKGYNPGNVQHRRAANLFRWLIRYNVEYVNLDFALVESSGFHAGIVNDHTLVHRYLPFEALRLLDLEHIESFIDSEEAGKFQGQAEPVSKHLQETLDVAQNSVVEILGPNYVASLAIHEGTKNELSGDQLFEFVISTLEEKLDFIPAVSLLAVGLISYGKPEVKRRLLHEVFKTGRDKIRTSVLSAAWDLSYLQALTLLDVGVHGQKAPAGTAILVTDDNALEFLASTLNSEGFLFMEPSLDFLDSGKVPRFQQLSKELRARRQVKIPKIPTREHLESICSSLEDSLEIPHLEFQIVNAPATVSISIELLHAVANVMRWEGQKLLNALTELPLYGDQLIHVLVLIHLSIADNSKKQERDRDESILAISTKMREDSGFIGEPTIGERLVWAYTRQDRIGFNALLHEVSVVNTDLYGVALFHACIFLRSIWLDTSNVINKSIEEIISTVTTQLTKENLESV